MRKTLLLAGAAIVLSAGAAMAAPAPADSRSAAPEPYRRLVQQPYGYPGNGYVNPYGPAVGGDFAAAPESSPWYDAWTPDPHEENDSRGFGVSNPAGSAGFGRGGHGMGGSASSRSGDHGGGGGHGGGHGGGGHR